MGRQPVDMAEHWTVLDDVLELACSTSGFPEAARTQGEVW